MNIKKWITPGKIERMKRNEAMLNDLKSGLSLAEVATKYGMSTAGVHLACLSGDKPKWWNRIVTAKRKKRILTHKMETALLKDRKSGMSYRELGKKYGITGQGAHLAVKRNSK